MLRPLVFLTLCLASPCLAQVQIVFDRKPTQATLYLSMPLDNVAPVLGVTLLRDAQLPGPDAFATSIELDGADAPLTVTFDAAVLHPSADPIPFDAPWDASVAVDFGGVADARDPSLPLTLYARFNVPDIDGHQALTLRFPNSTDASNPVTLRAYVRNQTHDRLDLILTPDTAIQLPAVYANATGVRWTIAFGILFVVTLAFDRWRRRPRGLRENTVRKP